jgi:hypothetical protein
MEINSVYINEKFYTLLPSYILQDVKVFNLADQKFWKGTNFIASPRFGKRKIWDMSNLSNFPIIDLSKTTNKTYTEISDQRASELESLIETRNIPLAIFWSGGIDSSLIICSILKNFKKENLSNVVVLMNNWSFLENPTLFNLIKENQLQIQNIDDLPEEYLNELFSSHIVTDGEPADKLWLVEIAIRYKDIFGNDSLNTLLRNSSESFIKFLEFSMPVHNAKYYFNFLLDNIKETNAPVETVGDLFWWVNFNYHWDGHLLGWYTKHTIKNQEAFKNYCLNYHPWYVTEDYQYWSFFENSKTKNIFSNAGEYKLEAKQYCFEIDKNEYYLKYKTKTGSYNRGNFKNNSLIILEDGTEFSGDIEEFISENYIG